MYINACIGKFIYIQLQFVDIANVSFIQVHGTKLLKVTAKFTH